MPLPQRPQDLLRVPGHSTVSPSVRTAGSAEGAVSPIDERSSQSSGANMRQLLGKAVQQATEPQVTIDTLRDELREERTLSLTARHVAATSREEVAELKAKLAAVQKELEEERSERMEEGAAAMEREEKLEAIIDEMKVCCRIGPHYGHMCSAGADPTCFVAGGRASQKGAG